MLNVKDQVYAALAPLAENVGDCYPKDWAVLPAIQYQELNNAVYEWTDEKEQKCSLLYQVDIWDNVSTSAMACQVDAALSALGLVRQVCRDVQDPSGMKHKEMQFTGIMDVKTEAMYHTNQF